MPAITPCLWFDDDLEEAMAFYVKIFADAEIGALIPTGPGGAVLAGDWTMNGQTFRGINGGPMFAQFTEAISFSIDCDGQDEVDYYWENLAAGGEYSQCGWLKDRFGLSWQVVPRRLFELQTDTDPARAAAATQAMMGMQKLVVADLEAAADAAGSPTPA